MSLFAATKQHVSWIRIQLDPPPFLIESFNLSMLKSESSVLEMWNLMNQSLQAFCMHKFDVLVNEQVNTLKPRYKAVLIS